MIQYTMEQTRAQVGGLVVALLLDTSQTLALWNQPDLLKAVETNIREIKAK
jgi:hypothetical protein